MSSDLPPTIDPVAAARWEARARTEPAWLHEEVGRRMEERLQWMRRQPRAWVDWDPLRGGVAVHEAIERRFPEAACTVVEPAAAAGPGAAARWGKAWWKPGSWKAPPRSFGLPVPGAADMLWCNMALHMAADPQALMARWLAALAVDGFVMFSCLGPDSLRELRAVYEQLGWPPPSHAFTDMHDWGDMLVHSGFAEPVLDMERIVLRFDSPARALQELRGLGRNLHPARFAGLRGRHWQAQLAQAWTDSRQPGSAEVELSFEVIYGHALKAAPRVRLREQSAVSLDDMRHLLRRGRDPA